MTCQSLVSSQHSRLSFSFNFKTDIKFVISKLKNLTRLSLKPCYLGKQWKNSASHEEWHLMHVEYELKQCCRTWSCAQFKERRGDNHALKKIHRCGKPVRHWVPKNWCNPSEKPYTHKYQILIKWNDSTWFLTSHWALTHWWDSCRS